jgi:hypothetical protein
MSECIYPNGKPVETNHREAAAKIFEEVKDSHPWYKIFTRKKKENYFTNYLIF